MNYLLPALDLPCSNAAMLNSHVSDLPQHEVMRIATQVRALRLVGKRVTLFAPVGEITGQFGLVQSIAEALAALDRNSVLVINAKEAGPELYEPHSQPSESGRRGSASTASDPCTDSAHGQLVTQQRLSSIAPGTLPALIDQARGRSEYVFIDASCVSESAITSLAAAHSDAVVLIIQEGNSRRKQVLTAKRHFADLNLSISGFIYLRGA